MDTPEIRETREWLQTMQDVEYLRRLKPTEGTKPTRLTLEDFKGMQKAMDEDNIPTNGRSIAFVGTDGNSYRFGLTAPLDWEILKRVPAHLSWLVAGAL